MTLLNLAAFADLNLMPLSFLVAQKKKTGCPDNDVCSKISAAAPSSSTAWRDDSSELWGPPTISGKSFAYECVIDSIRPSFASDGIIRPKVETESSFPD